MQLEGDLRRAPMRQTQVVVLASVILFVYRQCGLVNAYFLHPQTDVSIRMFSKHSSAVSSFRVVLTENAGSGSVLHGPPCVDLRLIYLKPNSTLVLFWTDHTSTETLHCSKSGVQGFGQANHSVAKPWYDRKSPLFVAEAIYCEEAFEPLNCDSLNAIRWLKNQPANLFIPSAVGIPWRVLFTDQRRRQRLWFKKARSILAICLYEILTTGRYRVDIGRVCGWGNVEWVMGKIRGSHIIGIETHTEDWLAKRKSRPLVLCQNLSIVAGRAPDVLVICFLNIMSE